MTREEEFYAAILAAINGDDHTCPEPVWRHEEFLKAIHDALSSGGGGGVLVVTASFDIDSGNNVGDKKCSEVWAAYLAGTTVLFKVDDVYYTFISAHLESGTYSFYFYVPNSDSHREASGTANEYISAYLGD